MKYESADTSLTESESETPVGMIVDISCQEKPGTMDLEKHEEDESVAFEESVGEEEEMHDGALPHLIMLISVVLVSMFGLFQLVTISCGIREKRNQEKHALPFLDHLPQQTVKAIGDQSSPQARALLWIKLDPKATEYSLERSLQRYNMATLYYALDGPHWETKTFWMDYTIHECKWSQAVCDDGALRRLHLSDNSLRGNLPFELGSLASLEFLDLSENPRLVGGVPAQLCAEESAGQLEIRADCSLVQCC